MDEPIGSASSTEDISSIGTVDVENLSTTNSSNYSNENFLEKRIEELTKQLNDSKSAEKRAVDERDKNIQIHNRTNERFLAFEQKQLDQMRRILTLLTSDQRKILSEYQDDYRRPRRAFTSPSTSILLPSSLNESLIDFDVTVDCHKTETEWNNLLRQISDIVDSSEKFAIKYSQQTEENNKLRLINSQKHDENVKLVFDVSLTKAEYEKEQHMRNHFEKQFNEANKTIEQDETKRLQKLRNYASLADDEGDILLSSLIKKAEKNQTDFCELKHQYENAFAEQIDQIKKLVKERELVQLYVERLEKENASLSARTNDDETTRLLIYASETPTSFEDASNLIKKLREQIIEQIKYREKLKNDIHQIKQNYKIDIREREQIEALLSRDLNAAKDEILILKTVQSEFEHVLRVKENLEKQLDQSTNELVTLRTVTNSLTTKLKDKLEEISIEKERINEENTGLRLQIQKLKVDFENSESVQHDFVKLSQTLQIQLEEIRNSENELRWQPEEDFSECQRCRQPFSVTWRKHHCRHCGKVLCKDCTSKIIYTGINNRPSRVCDFCYTLLNKDSQPYFFAETSK